MLFLFILFILIIYLVVLVRDYIFFKKVEFDLLSKQIALKSILNYRNTPESVIKQYQEIYDVFKTAYTFGEAVHKNDANKISRSNIEKKNLSDDLDSAEQDRLRYMILDVFTNDSSEELKFVREHILLEMQIQLLLQKRFAYFRYTKLKLAFVKYSINFFFSKLKSKFALLPTDYESVSNLEPKTRLFKEKMTNNELLYSI